MTLYMLFEALRDGRLTMDEEFAVSTKAKNMGGSTMFLNELDRADGRGTSSRASSSPRANEATVVVAEGLSGTEDAFARLMNQRAPEIGLTNSIFTNASGWPDANMYMSTRDLGVLSVRLIEDFPEITTVYFAQQEFDYKDRSPANRFNRNPLLGMDIGADGLKTGRTEEAGYGLAGSARQGNRRLVFVVTGLDSQAAPLPGIPRDPQLGVQAIRREARSPKPAMSSPRRRSGWAITRPSPSSPPEDINPACSCRQPRCRVGPGGIPRATRRPDRQGRPGGGAHHRRRGPAGETASTRRRQGRHPRRLPSRGSARP